MWAKDEGFTVRPGLDLGGHLGTGKNNRESTLDRSFADQQTILLYLVVSIPSLF